jgi:hypothetical protein
LERAEPIVAAAEFAGTRAAVTAIWEQTLGVKSPGEPAP